MSFRITRIGAARRLLAAAAVLGSATVMVVSIAPAAQATVTRVGVLPDMGFGSSTNYGTGCRYTAQAYVDNIYEPVVFYDNGAPVGVVRPGGAYALFPWVPRTPGPHRISAVQAPDETVIGYVDVRVGVGTHIGVGCLVFGG